MLTVVSGGSSAEVESQQVQMIRVECPGFASVEFDSETRECTTLFGTGTSIVTRPEGTYELSHCDGGELSISEDGTCVYCPKPNNDMDYMPMHHVYAMSHFGDVIVETVDQESNVFNVKHNGESVVITADVADLRQGEVEESDDGNTYEKKVIYYKQHAPRFFIIHANGGGSELLRYQDVAEYLAEAERDPQAAVLKDPLPDYPGVNGITIMKPYTKGISEKWLNTYSVENIIPPGLKSRDLKTLPAEEFKKPGPKFGTNVGRGLAVGSVVKPTERAPLLKCPTKLEIRQLLQFQPMGNDLREK